MERRTIITFLIIGLLTFAWMWRGQTRQRERAIEAQKQAAIEQAKKGAETAPVPATPSESRDASFAPAPGMAPTPRATPAPALTPVQEAPLQNDIRLASPAYEYELTWTNHGAALVEARLRNYAESLGAKEREVVLQAIKGTPATFALRDPKGELPLDTQNYEVIEAGPDRFAFATTFANGLRVTKEFLPHPGKYDLGVRVTFANTGHEPLGTQYDIIAAGRVPPENLADTDLQGAIGVRRSNGSTSVDRETPGNVSNKPYVRWNSPTEMVSWAGAANRYFAAALRPIGKPGQTLEFVAAAGVEALRQTENLVGTFGGVSRADNVVAYLKSQPRTLKPGEAVTDEYVYFIGPKDQRVLANYPEVAGVLDYGWFTFFAKMLLAILNGLHRLIPNYGIGIILLTVIVKVVLHPLTRKGQISMHKMQRLQPLIKDLQDKHKDDRQRQGREMMDLYRKHNANPMSGCWPMMFQLPILYGLFRMLQYSIELRQAGFLPVWITDLAQPDTIAYVGAFPIRILPVLMVVSWVVQQWTMPKPADPQQAQTQKMMMFMPIVFGFMLYGMAAGLTLYWLTSTFLGIVEQKLIKMQIHQMEARGAFSVITTEAAAPKGRTKPPKRK